MAKKNLTLEEKLEEAIVKETPYEVPRNWVWSKLGEICDKVQYGYTEKASIEKVGPHFLRITDIQENGVDWRSVPYCIISENDYEKYKLYEGDIVIARTGATTGKNYIISDVVDSVFASYLIRMKINNMIYNKFVSYYMYSDLYWKQIMEEQKGIAQPGVNAQKLGALIIPIPPLKEQQRIVNRIESLFEKLDKAKELIEEAREGFEKRKTAVLEKAFRGVLTEKWRSNNSEQSLAKDLLNKENYDKEYKYILPSKWRVLRLCDVATIIMGQSPKGESYNSEEIGTPLINGPVEFGDTPFSYTIKSKWTTKPTKMCEKNDLLLCVRGSTLGRINIAGFNACIGRGVAAIRANIYQRYVNYRIHLMREDIYNAGTGTTFPNISSKQIAELLIEVPPLEEQKEIVKILDKLLEEEAKIEELTQLEDQINLIKKSILAKAFRGQLGTNCEEDESALELLKKILSRS